MSAEKNYVSGYSGGTPEEMVKSSYMETEKS